MAMQIVIDTNIFISALLSRKGASFKLLSLIGTGADFAINLSVPLVLEYEDVAKRQMINHGLSKGEINDIIDYLCSVANLRRIHFLWRPFLKDIKDDMVLELAIEAQCDYIVSFNTKDFIGIEKFGLQAITLQDFYVK